MTEKSKQPLTGDAAWRAHKQQVSDNNEAAFKRARAERAQRDATAADKRHAAERRERDSLPSQPQRKA